jgi:hypothetical protein
MRDYMKDLINVYERVSKKFGNSCELEQVLKKIISLHKVGVLNINHSVLELITAGYLINEGYKVYVEVEMAGGVADLYAIKGIDLVIEVETGYVPPNNAVNAEEFLMGRLALKTARYSNVAHGFYIAVPSFYIPPIPSELLLKPDERNEEENRRIMSLIRRYTKAPDITLSDVKNSKIDGIITINSKELELKLIDVRSFQHLKEFYS